MTESMNLKIRKLQLWLLGCALAISLFFAVGAIAQTQGDRPDRDIRRIERRIDEIQKANDAIEKAHITQRVADEARWAVIETKLSFLQWIGAGIGGASLGLVAKAFFELLAARKSKE